ncbi:MAG: HNH endonuclease [Microcoleus sp. SIO2G3]|nr:HNH endonuclease [Microcoleus sp. SIO2G3]
MPKNKGGTDRYSNLALLHLFCHQQIHTLINTGLA